MNKVYSFVLATLALALFPLNSLALPTLSDVQTRLNLGAIKGPGVLLGYQVVANKVQLLKCKYDFAVQGGATASAINLKAVDGSNCSLPKNAIVIDGLIDVITAPDIYGSTTGTIEIGTGQAADDLKGATVFTVYSGRVATVPVGTAATAIKMTAARSPTMTASEGLTVGKFNVFIQYVLSD